MMSEPDQSEFVYDVPVYFLVACSDGEPPEEVGFRTHDLDLVTALRGDGIRCIPLFTDTDLAERFLAWQELLNIRMIEIASDEDLLDFLVIAGSRGYSHVMFDFQQESKPVRVYTTEAAIHALYHRRPLQ